MKVIFIKIGGSLLAPKDKLYVVNKKTLQIISKQIKELVLNYPQYKFILGNGAGSFGHSPAVDYGLKGELNTEEKLFGAGFVHRKVIELNTILVESLQKEKVKVFQFVPAGFLLGKEGKVKKIFLEGILNCLKKKCIPIVFGDVVPDESYGFSVISTETIFKAIFNKLLKKGVKVERVVFIGDYEGVYGRKGEVLKRLSYFEFKKINSHIKGAKGKDITGGMRHKLEEAFYFCKKGAKVNILGFSEKENRFLAVMQGKSVGTRLYY